MHPGNRPNWFIAWPVDGREWLAPLVAGAPPGLKRFHPDDLHITLAFLGAVAPEAAMASWRVIAEAPLGPLDGVLERVAGFGDPRAPSAFSVEVSGEAIREAIATWRGPLAEAAGARPDRYAPRAHCTVCRPRRESPDADRRAGLAWASALPALGRPVRLDRIALYTWSEDRRARQFQIIRERRL